MLVQPGSVHADAVPSRDSRCRRGAQRSTSSCGHGSAGTITKSTPEESPAEKHLRGRLTVDGATSREDGNRCARADRRARRALEWGRTQRDAARTHSHHPHRWMIVPPIVLCGTRHTRHLGRLRRRLRGHQTQLHSLRFSTECRKSFPRSFQRYCAGFSSSCQSLESASPILSLGTPVDGPGRSLFLARSAFSAYGSVEPYAVRLPPAAP
jgi:hypothetical protein